MLHLPGMLSQQDMQSQHPSSATVKRSRRRRSRPSRRELVPALVLLAALGVMVVPLLAGIGSIAELRDAVVQMRRAYNRAGMLTLQHRLAEYNAGSAFDNAVDHDELPGIDERLYQVAPFFPDMQGELEAIEISARALRSIAPRPDHGAWSAEELERWTRAVHDLDLHFDRLLGRLAEIETQRSRAYNSIGFLGMILAVGFLVLYLRQATRLELVAHDHRYRRRITLLTHKVQEDERRALARDLHDGTAQELAIARMATDKVEDDATRRMIEGSLTRAIDEIRFLARRLRPMPENYDTPAEMIRELCNYFESRNGLQFDFDLDRRLRLNWEETAVVHLYRIVQESLSNIVRHADATLVHVSLRQSGPRRIELTIEDNGVGLHEAEEGFGTRGMRERAELLSASFARSSPLEGGTIVRLEFPLEHEITADDGILVVRIPERAT
jgi:signal transduction histidine kinase